MRNGLLCIWQNRHRNFFVLSYTPNCSPPVILIFLLRLMAELSVDGKRDGKREPLQKKNKIIKKKNKEIALEATNN